MAASLQRVDDAPVAVDECDEAAKAAIEEQRARRTSARSKEPSARIKRTAVERIDDPPPATGTLLIERVTRAIERERWVK